jgi:hypothetical protein
MNKLIYIFCFNLLSAILGSQTLTLPLSNSAIIRFSGNIYCIGLARKETAELCIYRLTDKLQIADSIILKQEGRANEYLRVNADTIHEKLNVYLFRNNKKVTVERFDKNFKHVATVKNIESARLNNVTMFSSFNFYFKERVYDVVQRQDTGGKQFYLNCYELKSITENFDYLKKWQYAFERKNIRTARIIYADQKKVFLYVVVSEGKNTGEWILNINAITGTLIKGSKLNDKDEKNTYFYGNSLYDRNYKSLLLFGQKLPHAQYEKNTDQLTGTPPAQLHFYLINIDSIGEKTDKRDFRLPVTEVKTTGQKQPGFYITRVPGITKKNNGSIELEYDLYKKSEKGQCFYYNNSGILKIDFTEEGYIMPKQIISPNRDIEDYYVTKDKNDLNGLFCTDSSAFEENYHKAPPLPVKRSYKFDTNPAWVLSKSNPKKNTVNYSLLKLAGKSYKAQTIEEISMSQNPSLLVLSQTNLILSFDEPGGGYTLKLISW